MSTTLALSTVLCITGIQASWTSRAAGRSDIRPAGGREGGTESYVAIHRLENRPRLPLTASPSVWLMLRRQISICQTTVNTHTHTPPPPPTNSHRHAPALAWNVPLTAWGGKPLTPCSHHQTRQPKSSILLATHTINVPGSQVVVPGVCALGFLLPHQAGRLPLHTHMCSAPVDATMRICLHVGSLQHGLGQITTWENTGSRCPSLYNMAIARALGSPDMRGLSYLKFTICNTQVPRHHHRSRWCRSYAN